MVAPDLQGRGLGRLLLAHDRGGRAAPRSTAYVLFTGAGSVRQPCGCTRRRATGCARPSPTTPGVVRLTKRRRG